MSIGRPNESAPAALTSAVRDAARFDGQMVSGEAGLLAAVPVVAVLGGGIASGAPVAGVSMGAGAMLVGIAWRTVGGRPPLALMATDAAIMATSTFVGCVTGSVAWLHLLLLCLWSLMAGLLVGVGSRGAVVGTQAIIAVVVFGRFSQSAPAALGLAGLVLSGGLAQVVFLSVIRWPTPLRSKRTATATAYSALAGMARAEPGAPTLPVAAALDDAGAALASPALFGDAAVMTLRSLVNEGYRLRVEIIAIHTLISDRRSAPDDRDRETAHRCLALAAEALDLAARALGGDRAAADQVCRPASELSALVDATGAASPAALSAINPVHAPAGPAGLALHRRLAALAGQLRAIGSMAPAAGEGGGLRSRRPHRSTSRPLERLRADLAQLAENANLQSPAGRHALRLAIVVPVAELVSAQLPLQRGYWMVVAAATVLRPEFTATFTRGTERALGTCLGVALAGAIAVALHPAGGVTVVLVGALAWAAYSVFPASFALGFTFITALVVFLLNVISPDTLATAEARLLDTLVGGSIGLFAYAVWPTWAKGSAQDALAALAGAQRAYLNRVLQAIQDGSPAPEDDMRNLARTARLARTQADATVGRSLSEPPSRRIDPGQAQGALGAMRRLIQAAHVLRLDVQDQRRPHVPHPDLAPLSADLDATLATVQARFAGELVGARDHRDLRGEFEQLARTSPADADTAALLAELDEIVDAANGLAALAGLDDSDSA